MNRRTDHYLPAEMDQQVQAYLACYGRSSLDDICAAIDDTDLAIMRALIRLQAHGRVVREAIEDEVVYGLRDGGEA